MKKLIIYSLAMFLFAQNSFSQCWNLVWQDDFNGNSLNTADWNYWIGGAYNNELQYYTDSPTNVKVENGNLKLIARQEVLNGYNYTSGRIDTRFKVNFTYGRIEGRMKLNNGQGMWPAFWLLPTSGEWPAGGEMDIMELLGQEPNKTYGTCHYLAAGQHASLGSFLTLPSGNFSDAFHIFALEWSATDIKWSVDGQVYFTVTKTQVGSANWPFNKDFYVILNLAVGGNWPGPPNGQTVFPNTMEVDYVKIFQKNPNIKISGKALCEPSTSSIYKLPTWSGATYNWTVSAGGTIASGQNTSQITVNWNATSGNRTVGCTFHNVCGTRTVSIPVVVTPNLWENPSFESGTVNWNFTKNPPAAGTFTAPNQSGAPNGTKVGKIVCTTLGNNFWDFQMSRSGVAVEAGVSYTLRFHGKATVAGKITQVNFLNPNNFTNYAWQNITLTESWVLYQLTFIAPYTGNLLFTQDFGFNTGTFYMDNYVFGKTANLPPVAPVSVDRSDEIEISIFPNPTDDVLKILAAENGHFSLLNLDGKSVAAGDFEADVLSEISLKNQPSGIYVVEIQTVSGKMETRQIVKN